MAYSRSAWLLFANLTAVIFIIGGVTITTNPSTINGTSIHFSCTYNYTQLNLTLGALIWEFSTDKVNEMIYQYKYNFYGKIGPQGKFIGRIADFEGIDDDKHTFTLNKPNWCDDIGFYTCTIWSLQETPLHQQSTVHLKAVPGELKMFLNDKEFSEDKMLTGPSQGRVTCTTSWNSPEFKVTLISKSNISTSNGLRHHGCTHNASVMHQYLLGFGEEDIFTCIAEHNGFLTTVIYRRLSVQAADNTCVPAWIAVIIPTVAALIIGGTSIMFCKRHKCPKGSLPRGYTSSSHEETELELLESEEPPLDAEKNEIEKLQSALKTYYLREFDKVRFLPWDDTDHCFLSDLYVNLTWERRQRKASRVSMMKLEHYTDVLSALPDKPTPLRIFVLGEPGIGKTTFSKKIALDWATKAHPRLAQFFLVFTVFLRFHKPCDTIANTICRQLLRVDGGLTPDKISNILKQQGEHCLIILDGLDEVFQRSTDFTEMIQANLYGDVPIIITTRPVGDDTIKHADAVARITGFQPAGVDKYINKFFVADELDTGNEIKSSLCAEEIHRRKFLGMSQIPLLLHLFCLLFNQAGKLPETMTGVYKSLKKYVLKRYQSVKSEKGELVKDCELRAALDSLCKLAYDGIISGGLVFDADKQNISLNKYLLELGFLSSWHIPHELDRKKQLTFVHKSFQEYFTAEYVTQNFQNIDRFWEYCDTKDKVLALKMMFAMCCGLSPEIGVKMLKKIQEMMFMSEVYVVCPLQVQCLCEVMEAVDISDLHCYKQLYIIQDHAPANVCFRPTVINIEGSKVEKIDVDTIIVSRKRDHSNKVMESRLNMKEANSDSMQRMTLAGSGKEICFPGRSIKICTDRLNSIKLEGCELDSGACQSLYNTVAQLRNVPDKPGQLEVATDCGEHHGKTLEIVIYQGDIDNMPLIVQCATHTQNVHTLAVYDVPVHLHQVLCGQVLPTSLRNLFLDCCKMGKPDVCALFTWPYFHQLTELNLSHNNLSDTLSDALSGCSKEVSLRKLYLFRCGLTGQDVKALAQWLKLANHLEKLRLKYNTARGDELQPIQDVMATRKHAINIRIDTTDDELKMWRCRLPQHTINE